MSFAAMNATRDALPGLRDRLQAMDAKRRPSWPNTVAVCLHLADRYQDRRGFVDETVDQVSGDLLLPRTTVRTVLAALDHLGFWVAVQKGNQHRGTRRSPGFMQRGADPDKLHGEQRGADPADRDVEHRGVEQGASRGSTLSIAGYDPQQRGADPATPRTPHIPPTTSSSPGQDDESIHQLVRRHLRAHVAWNAHKLHDPAAVARSEHRHAIGVAREAIEWDEDPAAALEATWPTRAPDNAGDFDPGNWTDDRVRAV